MRPLVRRTLRAAFCGGMGIRRAAAESIFLPPNSVARAHVRTRRAFCGVLMRGSPRSHSPAFTPPFPRTGLFFGQRSFLSCLPGSTFSLRLRRYPVKMNTPRPLVRAFLHQPSVRSFPLGCSRPYTGARPCTPVSLRSVCFPCFTHFFRLSSCLSLPCGRSSISDHKTSCARRPFPLPSY